MSIDLEKIKELREKTAVSIAECKAALEETGGDIPKAIEVLRKRGIETASRKLQKETKNGIVAHYIHTNRRVGSLVVLHCETDFVAENEEFLNLGRDLAMQVVASNPKAISPEEIATEELEKEKEIYREQLLKAGKPAEIVEKALEGKISKFKEENALLTQPFIKDPGRKVNEIINEVIAKTGENIKIGRFIRFEV